MVPVNADVSSSPLLVHGRSCGECALCCKLPEIADLNKPAGQWCQFCDSRKGCSNYENRPLPCRNFHCLYLTDPQFGEEWNPMRARMHVSLMEGGAKLQMVVMVDPDRRDTWRKEPYYSQLKRWSSHYYVSINIGKRRIFMFPDHDVDLGDVEEDTRIEMLVEQGPQGPRQTARAVSYPAL